LDTIWDGTVCLGWARTRRVHSLNTERNITSLIAAELGEVRARELAMEQPVKFCVLGCRLAIGNLEAVRL
jgi:hypothetical protein